MGLFQWLEQLSGFHQEDGIRVPDASGSPTVRKRFRFIGRVQGVGFRYQAQQAASVLGLTGWVKNEPDGTVSGEAEGPEACVNEFLRALEAVPRFCVQEVRTEHLPPLGTEKTFRVVY